MDPIRGAGARVKAEFTAGHMHFVAENRAFRNENNQEFFFTTHDRIMRYDVANQQFNVYDPRLKEFVPCELLPGEDAVQFGEQRELFEALIGRQGWGDFLLDRAGRIAIGAGKQAIFGAAAGVAASFAAPIVTRGVGAAIDALHPAAASVKTSVTTQALHAKAQAASHVAQAKANAAEKVANNFCPPFPGPKPPFGPMWPPPPVDVPPWIPPIGRPPWWLGGILNAGGTASGAGVGFLLGGPPGAFIGSIIGAGASAGVGL